MTRNVGGADRGVRLVAGSLLLGFSFLVEWPGYWGLAPFAAGIVLLATGILRFCPVNAALGLNTQRA